MTIYASIIDFYSPPILMREDARVFRKPLEGQHRVSREVFLIVTVVVESIHATMIHHVDSLCNKSDFTQSLPWNRREPL